MNPDMKLNLKYGYGVISIPAAVYPDLMPPDISYLYVLLAVCKNPALLQSSDTMIPAVASECRLPEQLVGNAVAYWLDTGIFEKEPDATADTNTVIGNSASAMEDVQTMAASEEQTTPQDAGHSTAEHTAENAEPAGKHGYAALPHYSEAELAEIISETNGLHQTLDECARIAGKMLSLSEREQLTALYTSYGMDGAYLLMVLTYCKTTLQKNSVAYAVRTALGFYDEGIRTEEELEAHIAAKERSHKMEYRIRNLFGIGERAFTKAEKQYIFDWTVTWNMSFEMISCAYEMTIEAIGKPRLNYVNKMLQRWHEAGLNTLEAVRADAAEFRAKHPPKEYAAQGGASLPHAENGKSGTAQTKSGSAPSASYDIDEFLELAMKRSFDGDDTKP